MTFYRDLPALPASRLPSDPQAAVSHLALIPTYYMGSREARIYSSLESVESRSKDCDSDLKYSKVVTTNDSLDLKVDSNLCVWTSAGLDS